MMTSYPPIDNGKSLKSLLKEANSSQKPIKIESVGGDKGGVLIGEDEWRAIQETLFLVDHGVDKQIKAREQDSDEDFKQLWDAL